jgi:polysaccharide export outer membrane protein
LTTSQAGTAIAAALKGKAVNPQVVVTIADNVANSVSVVGEVHNPGRYPLFDGSDHILDVLAAAAGATKSAGDVRVVVVRGNMSASVSLAQLLSDTSQNIRLAPHDMIRLVDAPRKISTFGAFAHNAEIPIEDESLTLAAALSKAGGLDPGGANGESVYLFRFERPQVAAALNVRAPVSVKGVPIIYHLNLRKADELFVANQFEVQANDLIYVPRAGLAELQQFLGIVQAASSIAYNARVTTAVVQ